MAPVRVDIISDIACPWCLIGWLKFQQVMAHFEDKLEFDVHWRHFELNPNMPPEGVDAAEYMASRYGISSEQGRGNRARISQAAEEMGFSVRWDKDFRMRNSFDAHRLLAWAGVLDEQGEKNGASFQSSLKMRLFEAHFAEQADIADRESLISFAGAVGLDERKAREILKSDLYEDVVRADELYWRDNGISSVPTFILNEKMMIPGAQEPETFIRLIEKRILS